MSPDASSAWKSSGRRKSPTTDLLAESPHYNNGVAQNLSAFVLAGGESSRMGRDKAFLELDGRSLLARALELARAASADVHVVGPRAKFARFGSVVEDVRPGCGPLGGIYSALLASSTELNLILAVDTPFIQPVFLDYLREQAEAGSAVVTLPRIGGRYQTLCAVYRRAFAEPAGRALERGLYKIDPLFAEVELRCIEEPELARLAFDPRMFDNLNTDEEWRRAQERARNL